MISISIKPCQLTSYPIDENYHRLIKGIWLMPSMLRIMCQWVLVDIYMLSALVVLKELLDIIGHCFYPSNAAIDDIK